MIDETILRNIQSRLMTSMTELYLAGEDDWDSQMLANRLVQVYDDIEFELTTRSM